MGYVRVTIAKTLVPNAQDIKLFLDENKLDCFVSSTQNSLALTFSYHHSVHQVTIKLATNVAAEQPILDMTYWTWLAIAAIVAIPIVSFLALKSMRNKTQESA
jgi:hypothetical protein